MMKYQMFFWAGIAFLANSIYNFLSGKPDDSYIFALLFLIWGWDDRPNFLKEKWLKSKWGLIRYRHVVTLESTEEGFYIPIHDWIIENIGKKNDVWLNLEQTETIITGVTGNAVRISLDSRTYEFRFKKKKDAAHFRLVWG